MYVHVIAQFTSTYMHLCSVRVSFPAAYHNHFLWVIPSRVCKIFNVGACDM
eukprot:c44438_g1_i1 orf=93-245(+)